MDYEIPRATTEIAVDGLGIARGLEYSNGVRQFCGVPYATIPKRWSRARLADAWPASRHDGTRLGPSAPIPPEYEGESDDDSATPVPQFPHLPDVQSREKDCLVLNITIPPASVEEKLPVMVYIHGGAFVFGGANRSLYDGVQLVTESLKNSKPIVVVTLNYRIGLGGFLASEAIRKDLAADGHTGVGNFGITDQVVALRWVQRYIHSFLGDKHRVTLVGESAGASSVALHLLLGPQDGDEPYFQQAIQMSGGYGLMPAKSLVEHEDQYRKLCKLVGIDPDAPDSLEQLRAVHEATVTAATLPVQDNVIICNYSPCIDGVLLKEDPRLQSPGQLPSWLEAWMCGDVKDEATVFRANGPFTYRDIRSELDHHCGKQACHSVIEAYGLKACLSDADHLRLSEELLTDALFSAEVYTGVHRSRLDRTFAYHFRQPNSLRGSLRGTAHHALDLVYLFGNMKSRMDETEIALAQSMASDFILFINGEDPWERFSRANRWRTYGPMGYCGLRDEHSEDLANRHDRLRALGGEISWRDINLAMSHIAWRSGCSTRPSL